MSDIKTDAVIENDFDALLQDVLGEQARTTEPLRQKRVQEEAADRRIRELANEAARILQEGRKKQPQTTGGAARSQVDPGQTVRRVKPRPQPKPKPEPVRSQPERKPAGAGKPKTEKTVHAKARQGEGVQGAKTHARSSAGQTQGKQNSKRQSLVASFVETALDSVYVIPGMARHVLSNALNVAVFSGVMMVAHEEEVRPFVSTLLADSPVTSIRPEPRPSFLRRVDGTQVFVSPIPKERPIRIERSPRPPARPKWNYNHNMTAGPKNG